MSNVVKIIFVLTVFLTDYSLVYSQALTWQKWYDYEHFDEAAWDALQTFDKGYAILSTSFSFPDSTVLMKLDFLGNVLWKKVYGDSLGQPLSQSLQQTSDSGFVVAGGVGSVRGYLSKLDKNGNLLWKKYYKKGNLNTRFWDCKTTKDGGIIACGDLYPPTNWYVVKTDLSGNIEWDSVYTRVSRKIIQSTDGNYYFCGVKSLTKINLYGRILWGSDFPFIAGQNLVEHPSGSIFMSGGIDSINVIKHDTSGNAIWNKSYYKGANGYSLCVGKDQNILLIGYADSLAQLNLAAVKINVNGDQIFKKSIETVKGNWFKFPSSVNPTEDSGYIISGYTDYPGFPYNDNVLVVKSDSTCFAPKIVGIYNPNSLISENFFLNQNYPNPFNSSTLITYSINKSTLVILSIYDINGKEVVTLINTKQHPGSYEMKLNADNYNLSSGLYFCKLSTEEKVKTIKLLFLK